MVSGRRRCSANAVTCAASASTRSGIAWKRVTKKTAALLRHLRFSFDFGVLMVVRNGQDAGGQVSCFPASTGPLSVLTSHK
jgi:hypothetical protein